MDMNRGNMGLPTTRPARTYGMLGILSSFLSLMFLSELFGSAAIILGAYQVKREPEASFGIIVVILGIISLLAGIFLTAYPLVYDLVTGY